MKSLIKIWSADFIETASCQEVCSKTQRNMAVCRPDKCGLTENNGHEIDEHEIDGPSAQARN